MANVKSMSAHQHKISIRKILGYCHVIDNTLYISLCYDIARTPAPHRGGPPLASTAIKSKRGGGGGASAVGSVSAAGSITHDEDDVASVSASISALSTGMYYILY
mgnify:FL=1